MTQKTGELIDRLCGLLDKNKYLLLEGGIAVGKTFIAKETAKALSRHEYDQGGGAVSSYDVVTEMVSIHPSYSYEDFVTGMSLVADGSLNFRFQDRIFLTLLKRATESWQNQDNKKYVLIIDDIQRGYLPGILGDVMTIIEPHGQSCFDLKTKDGQRFTLPPNFYIIATKNNAITGVNDNGSMPGRRFYHYTICSDFKYIYDAAVPALTSSTDMSANALYNRVKKIVENFLSYRYRISEAERQKYIIGHGMFLEKDILTRVKYQIIPMLEQYLKEGIIERAAISEINILKKMVKSRYSKDPSFCNDTIISVKVKNADSTFFLANAQTHKPFLSLISRIKEQKLLCDEDIMDSIIFNPNVLQRRKATFNKAEYVFPVPACLFVKKDRLSDYYYGTTKSKRMLYSKTDSILINGTEYAVAAEMQPNEYNRWSDDILTDGYINEKNSTSPNTILVLLLKNYYDRLISNYEDYLSEWPSDNNIRLLQMYAKEEWDNFVTANRSIVPASGLAADNSRANGQVRNEIAKLKLLWSDTGDLIMWGGQTIRVEGAYRVSAREKYQEYLDTMEKLNIHQMVIQGPPGTSKTYSARGLLKFAGGDGNSSLMDKELNVYQLRDYDDPAKVCEWSASHGGQAPRILWDIVQFHPSYGYEDFVRGIEVSTVANSQTGTSAISYDTVNKILGKMADTAMKPEFSDTKFYLVVDEINRANLATVFGELIYGLEYRNEGVSTPYTVKDTNKIMLPDNLYIVGTMNTADKSIGGIDYAIRRRFLFFSLLPDKDAILKYNRLFGHNCG